eukprot:12595482-Alexandrium_andersonii.AAC.1
MDGQRARQVRGHLVHQEPATSVQARVTHDHAPMSQRSLRGCKAAASKLLGPEAVVHFVQAIAAPAPKAPRN